MGTAVEFRRPSHGIAAESHMEASAAAARVIAFAEDELRTAFRAADIPRLYALQKVHQDAKAILREHRRQAGWHDSLCADGVAAAGHGRAA
jgi:hypothetical protein